jgi:tryptophan-rich sensory protein
MPMKNTLFSLSYQVAIPPWWHFLFALALSSYLTYRSHSQNHSKQEEKYLKNQ